MRPSLSTISTISPLLVLRSGAAEKQQSELSCRAALARMGDLTYSLQMGLHPLVRRSGYAASRRA